MKKNINIGEVDSLSLLGTNDRNLKVFEKHFSSKIVVRGNMMIIDGSKDEISAIEAVVKDMLITVNQKGFITEDDVKALLNLSDNGVLEQSQNDGENPVVLYTHKGAVYARTPGQKKYLDAVLNNDIVFAIGPAGTGKTYQAVASAVSALKNREVERIVITRPAVEAGERLGFLPGDLKEKIDPYLTPVYDALSKMIKPDKLKGYFEKRTIEVAPLAYMRGRTLHNSFMILDEAQNATRMQMKMFLTRLGVTSRAIVTGDITQVDLPNNEVCGLMDAVSILKGVKGIEFIYFHEEDVVRHKLVKNIIKAYSENGKES